MTTINCLNGHPISVFKIPPWAVINGTLEPEFCPKCQSELHPDIEADFTDEDGTPDWWDDDIKQLLTNAGA